MTDASGGFRDRQAAIEYILLSAGTFLLYTTYSQSALLAVVMKTDGVPLAQIGVVLAAFGAAVIPFMLLSGPLAARLGNLGTLRLGMALMLLAQVSFQFTLTSLPAALLSRVVQGMGYGFFLPTAMAFARSKLGPARLVTLFGMYSCMVSAPNALGPPLAEAYLHHFGESWFFIVGAVPAMAALLLSLPLTDRYPGERGGACLPLLGTTLLPGLRRPLLAILVVGALYGLVQSYLAPILAAKQVPLAVFYTSFTIVVLLFRFGLMATVERWPRLHVLCGALAAMAVSYVFVALPGGWPLVLVAGVLFGTGYGIAYPALSIWVTEQFDPQQRTTPLAVFNSAFAFGILLTPWCGSYVIAGFGNRGLLYALTGIGFAVLPYLLMARGVSAAQPKGALLGVKRSSG